MDILPWSSTEVRNQGVVRPVFCSKGIERPRGRQFTIVGRKKTTGQIYVKNKNILLVPGDSDQVGPVKIVLEDRGYAVHSAPREAICDFSKKHKPNLLILDLVSPHVNSLEMVREALRQIKKAMKRSPVPLILLVGQNDDGQLLDAYKLGADYFVRKPLQTDKIVDAVNLFLGF